jgi:cytochrome c biogenesis protein CcmG, thiol:disulfide interchange protein DsbE
MRVLPFITFITLSLGMLAMLINKNQPTELGRVQNQAMPSIQATTLDGSKPWNAKALEGRVTVINIFATWCTPCAAEMPELIALKKQFPTAHFEGIAWNDQPANLRAWLKTNGNPFKTIWIDNTGDATIALGIKAIPETFIIDKKGVIRYRLMGMIHEDMRHGALGELIQNLLDEGTRAP